MSEIKKHIITVLVDNEAGALARIVDLFSGRGYSIESLNVAPISQDHKLSRITITTFGTTKTVDLICKLLNRIVPVHKAIKLSKTDDYIERELALVKVIGDKNKRDQAIKIADKYRTNIVNVDEESVIFEIIGTSEAIDEVIAKLANFGLSDLSRSGIVTGFKGSETIYELAKDLD